jgi:hypothetical protein
MTMVVPTMRPTAANHSKVVMTKMIDRKPWVLSAPAHERCPRLPLSEDELHLTDDELDRLCDIALCEFKMSASEMLAELAMPLDHVKPQGWPTIIARGERRPRAELALDGNLAARLLGEADHLREAETGYVAYPIN